MDKYLIVLGVVAWWLYGLAVLTRFEHNLTGLSFKQCMGRASAPNSVFFRHTPQVFFLSFLGPLIWLGVWFVLRKTKRGDKKI